MGEEVPGGAGLVDDVVVIVEDGDGELIGAQILPDVLPGVELGGIGRQRDQRDVVGDGEIFGDMVASAIDDKRGVRAGRDLAADLSQVQGHDLGIGGRHDERGGGAALRASGAEDVGPVVASVARRTRPGSALGPDAGQRALLADARLVLEPDFEWPALGAVGEARRHRRGEVFLNAAWSASSLSGWRGRTDSRR